MSGKIGPIIQQLFVLDFTGDQLDRIATGIDRENMLRQLDGFFRPETCKRQVVVGLSAEKNLPENLRAAIAPKTGAEAYAFLLRFILGIFSDKPGETHVWHQFSEVWAAYRQKPHFQKTLVPLIDQLFNDARRVRNLILRDLPRYEDRIGASMSLAMWPDRDTVLIVCGESALTGSLVKQLLRSKRNIERLILSHPHLPVAESCLENALKIGAHSPATIETQNWDNKLLVENKTIFICAASGGADQWGIDRALGDLLPDSSRNIFHIRGSEGDASDISEMLREKQGPNIMPPFLLDWFSDTHNSAIQTKALCAYHLCAYTASARLVGNALTTRDLAAFVYREVAETRAAAKKARSEGAKLPSIKELFEKAVHSR